jgi:NAD(P)-dependent dehydrogenase (short-subunit alcohol dehydrogenase family)
VNAPPSDASALLADPSRTLYTKTDVTKSPSLQNAVDATVSWIEGTTHAPLGGLVACAGVGYGERVLPRQDAVAAGSARPRKVKTMSIDAFDRVIAINLRGTVDLIRLIVPHLAAVNPGDSGERGVLILVSSVAAYEGQVGQVAYSASKAAVAGIVLPLARELGRAAGIRVLGIAPALFETAMTKAVAKAGAPGKVAQQPVLNDGMVEFPRRMGRPEEFASFVLECFQNGIVNGSVFRLDGAVRMPSRL